jgi:hypothetical protein
MEDFIYILIGVVWLGASIYRASQKRKEKARPKASATSTPASTTRESKARSLLEELLGGQEVSIPEPEVQEVEYAEPMRMEVEELDSSNSFHKEYAKFGYGGVETLTTEGVSSLGRIIFKDQMPVNENKTSRHRNIDLRKAIIYQAILERPYT